MLELQLRVRRMGPRTAFAPMRPRLADLGALMIAVGISGATIMSHALFLHSGLAAERVPHATPAEKHMLLARNSR